MPDGQGQGVLASLGQNERKALGGERLELVGVEVEHAAIHGRRVGPRQCGLRKRRGDERTEQVRGAFSQASFREVADDDGALIHQAPERDGASGLRQHVAQARHHERLADLVLNRSNRLAAEAVGVSRIFILPKGTHHRIADMLLDEPHAEALVDQQAGEHQQRRTGNIEQRAHGVGEDVVEARPPAVRPDVPERRHDAISHNGLEVVRHVREGIEADGTLDVRRVEVDQIVGARAGNIRERGLRKVAMRIEQRETFPGGKVLADQVEEERALAGAGLPDHIEVSSALLVVEQDIAAQRVGADAELLI